MEQKEELIEREKQGRSDKERREGREEEGRTAGGVGGEMEENEEGQ